jgi:hypothetical protein
MIKRIFHYNYMVGVYSVILFFFFLFSIPIYILSKDIILSIMVGQLGTLVSLVVGITGIYYGWWE